MNTYDHLPAALLRRLPDQPCRRRSRRSRALTYAALLFVALAAAPGAGAVEITHVEMTNVTPSSFTVFWQATAPGTPSLTVYSDATGFNDITENLRIEFFPLVTGDVTLPHEYADRIDRRNLEASLRENGLFMARVSLCQPATDYHVRTGLRTDGGEEASAPAEELLAVRTAAYTAFVAESLQVMVEFPGGDADGLIATLDSPAAAYPLAWAVGDSGFSNRAFFNLTDLIDPDTNTNLQPTDQLPLIVRLHRPGVLPEVDDEVQIAFADAFVVARVTDLIFSETEPPVLVHGFAFSSIGTQTAGVPFRITIRAIDSAGDPVTDFTGVTDLSATGELLQGGGTTPAFTGGQLAGYLVALEEPGEHRIVATLPGGGATSSSEPFIVSGSYDRWLLTEFPDPRDRENPGISGHHADPWGTGISNLLAYATGNASRNPDRARLPRPVLHRLAHSGDTGSFTVQSSDPLDHTEEAYLAITFARAKGATDVIFIPEISEDLVTWSSGPSFTEEVEVLDNGDYELVTARDLTPLNGHNRRFMRLRVRSGESFAAWQARHFTGESFFDPDWSGPAATPAGDGIPNLMKYALALDPQDSSRDELPRLATVKVGDERFLMLSYFHPAAVQDLEYVMEVSSDLIHWDSGSQHTETMFNEMLGNRFYTVERDLTPLGENRRFARLLVRRK